VTLDPPLTGAPFNSYEVSLTPLAQAPVVPSIPNNVPDGPLVFVDFAGPGECLPGAGQARISVHTFFDNGSPIVSGGFGRIVPNHAGVVLPPLAPAVTGPGLLGSSLLSGLLPGHVYRLQVELANANGVVRAPVRFVAPHVCSPPPPLAVALVNSPSAGRLRVQATVQAGAFGAPTELRIRSRLPFGTPIIEQRLWDESWTHGQVVTWDIYCDAGSYTAGQLMLKARIWDHKKFISRTNDFWDSWFVPVLGGPVIVS